MEKFEKEKLLHFYYDNDSAELKKIVLGVLRRLNYANSNDLEEFYSIANYECWQAIDRFEPDNKWGATFKTFISSILIKKFISEINKRNKRNKINGKDILSLDDEANGLEDVALIDTISSDERTEDEAVFKLSTDFERYLDSLSLKQRKIAELIMEGYSLNDAREKLKMSKPDFDNQLKFMRCPEKKKVFDSCERVNFTIKGGELMKNNTTMEKSKNTRYSVNELVKKMNNKTLNFCHPLQRKAGQWSNKQKSDLISDILQGNPIPSLIFAEQIIDGTCITFNLDGKQRCTNVKEYVENDYKISKNVSRNIISYQSSKKDSDGKIMVNEKGYPLFENVEFDITNKKFFQLPEELQEKILDYNFDAILFLNCSDNDIAYHLQRYNQGKAMNSAQKGLTYLGEDFAREVKAIASLPFFQDNGFTFKQYNNGTFNRIVIEAVMAVNFLDDWKKTPEEISIFLNKNASFKMFEDIEDSIIRLQELITPDIKDLFDAKNTFLWLTLFDRFKKLGLKDEQFIAFLSAFDKELKYRKINDETFISIDEGKNTKDKSVLIKKVEHLEALMNVFFYRAAA